MKRKASVTHLALFVLLVLTVFGAGEASLPGARAQGMNRVALVVQHGDGSVITRCVEFGESEISGYDVLTRAGLSVVVSGYSGMGFAVCSIDGEGCPAGDCFCQCQASPCVYWAYYHLVGGQWQNSSLGASSHLVHSGDVEGWAWGEGSIGSGGAQPPVIPFDQICAPPPTDTPIPTDTPVPPTATSPPPTDTPLPAPTLTVPPPAPTVWFRLDNNPIPASTCTMVRWDTADALEVYLDGERVGLNGGRQVCPAAAQEYQIRVVGAGGEQTETLVLGVTGAPLSPTPTSQLAVLPSPSPTDGDNPPASLIPSTGSVLQPDSAAPQAATPTPGVGPSNSSVAATLSTSGPEARAPLSPTATPTPQLVAIAPPLPASARADDPTPVGLEQPASDAGQDMAEDGGVSQSEGPTLARIVPIRAQLGFITFNFILIGLLGWLIVKLLRRR